MVAYRERQRDIQWLTGVIASAVANWGMRAVEEPIQPRDFPLPLLQIREKPRPINRKKIAKQIRSNFENAMKAARRR